MILSRSFSFARSTISELLSPELIKVNTGALYVVTSRLMSTGEVGSGAGKGGGGGGSVREAGGAMGKKGAAQEEMYFSKQNKAMKDKLKEHLKDEIKKHEDAIKASKELVKEIEKDS